MAFRICQRLRVRSNMRMVGTKAQAIATPKTTISALANGVRLATENSGGRLASINVSVRSGSINETELNNGVGHLLQTASVKHASKRVLKLGAYAGGNASREHTNYTISCLPEKVPEAISILGQILQEIPPEEAVEESRKQLLSCKGDLWWKVNEEVISDFFHSSAYQGTAYQQTPGGEIKTLKKLTMDDLKSFRNQFYKGGNIVVSAVGAIPSHQEVESLVNASFSAIPDLETPRKPSELEPRTPFVGSFMHIRDETVDDIQVAIGFETFPITHEQVMTVLLLRELVGSWHTRSSVGTNSSSRLGETLALEKLATNFHTFVNFYETTGHFGVYANTKNVEHLDDMVYEIFNEFNKINTYVTPEELLGAKNRLKARILANEENVLYKSVLVGNQIQTVARRTPVCELFHRVDELSIADVQRLLNTYFYDVDPVVVAHGELEEMPDYSVMRGWTYWNRW